MEKITAGHLKAVCAGGFALGALASWGVFYEYRCATGVKPLDASAWAQVLVAAVVGAAAVYVPKQISNSDRRRRTEIFVALLSNVLQPLDTLSKLLVEDCPDLVFIDGVLRDIDLQGKALESYPVADIPSPALLLHSVEAKSHYPGLVELTNKLLPAIEAHGGLLPGQALAVNIYGNSIRKLLLEVEAERP